MQVLKEIIRENIVSSAKQEFLNKGYSKASMRDIASQAGITVGNIYRYYDSKELLFDSIVNPAFEKLNELINSIQLEKIPNADYDLYIKERNLFSDYFLNMLQAHKEEIIILIRCSEGTKYKETKSHFAKTIENKVGSFVFDSFEGQTKENDNSLMARVISKNVVDGLTEIVFHNGFNDMEKLKSDVKLLMDLYFHKTILRINE